MVRWGWALAALSLALAGCGHDQAQKNADRAASLSVEDRIKQIQNTPGLPDTDKARLTDELQHRQGSGKQ